MRHLLDFLNVPLIKQMLMLDIAFYGMGLADIVGGKYSQKNKGSIQAFCPAGSAPHVHRLMQFYGGEKKSLRCDTYFAKSVLCVYTFAVFNFQIELRFENPPMNSSIPKSFANVGNLYVTRSGLHCLNDAEACTPFTDIVQDCVDRTCDIDVNGVLQPNLYTNLRNLVRNNWSVRNLKISMVDSKNYAGEEKCPICHEIFSGNIVRTNCQHHFCTKCWENYWQSACQSEVDTSAFRFSLRTSPNVVSCPMCRHEYKPWEVVPLEFS